MRHADAELQLWLANDRIARERHDAEMAALVGHGRETPTLRQRAGGAVIALGERLAGDPDRTRLGKRRLASRAS